MGKVTRKFEVIPDNLMASKRARKIISTKEDRRHECYTSIIYVEDGLIKEKTYPDFVTLIS